MNLLSSQIYQTINVKGELLSLKKPLVMGILNITPDSFFTESRTSSINNAISKCSEMLIAGAAIIDVGAQSTRPGAQKISCEEELNRLTPVLTQLSKEFPKAIFSIDTFYSEVAKAAIDTGGHLINDISGGTMDTLMFKTIAELKVPYVLGHIQGTPENMGQNPTYDNVVIDVVTELSKKIQELHLMGVNDILVDPGFGFGKTIEQNFELLNLLDQFKILDKAIAVGLSRKSMIWKTLTTNPEESLNGTTALNMTALIKGASILRVHDVKEAIECVSLYTALNSVNP